MTEQQRYHVVEKWGDIERRHYPRCTVADVTVSGREDRAAFSAFQPLVSYIGGRNTVGPPAPAPTVSPEPGTSRQLAMTAPVLQEPNGGVWRVSFVLPGGDSMEAYPTPTDARVTLREVPPHDAAALRWSGRWSTSAVRSHENDLLAQAAAAGWVPIGSCRWARYNPPWTPWFLRRNEVLVTLASASEDSAPM